MGGRLLMGLALTAGCALAGHAWAASRARRAKALFQLLQGLEALRELMLESLLPLSEALGRTPSPVLRRVGNSMEGVSAGEAWKRVKAVELARGGRLDALRQEDLEPLDRLFQGLGLTGRAHQQNLLEGASRALALLEEAARAGVPGKDRLYTTLGLLAGLTLAVVLM